jgi:thiol-disulfide isomerase/thioredoxin
MAERSRSGRNQEQPSTVAGRRTLGPRPRPPSRYSLFVGLIFLALVVVAFISMLTTRNPGTLGLDKETSDLPLPEFAVPAALSPLEGDANVAQDDCSSSQLPCPSSDRRTPACRIHAPGAIRVCDLFGRPLMISFWFTKGGDCEAQQDVLSRVYERYRGRVNFLSLDVRDDRDTVRGLIRERGWKMPVGYDHDGAVAALYRIGGCPTFVFAYPGGVLERATIGHLGVRQLERKVNALLAATRRKAAQG